MRRRLKKPKSLRRVLRDKAKQNKTATTIIGAWFLTQTLSSLFRSLPDLNDRILLPIYQNWILWNPMDVPKPIGTEFYRFNLLFWPLVGLALIIQRVVLYAAKKLRGQGTEEEVTAPHLLYEEEFAATVEEIDHNPDPIQVEAAIETFIDDMRSIITANLRLSRKDYRLYFLVSKAGSPSVSSLMSGGKHDKKKLTPEEEQQLKDDITFDFTEFTKLLNGRKGANTHIIDRVHNPREGEPTAYLLVRNPGELRLAMCISVLKNTTEKDILEYEEIFPKVSYIVTTISFVDKVVQYLVK